MIRALLVTILLAGCGGSAATPEPTPEATPSPSAESRSPAGSDAALLDRDRIAFTIEATLNEVDEAICDPSGQGQPEVAICYIGIDSSSEATAEAFLCDEVMAVIRTFTDQPVTLVGFNSADDQVTSPAPDCG